MKDRSSNLIFFLWILSSFKWGLSCSFLTSSLSQDDFRKMLASGSGSFKPRPATKAKPVSKKKTVPSSEAFIPTATAITAIRQTDATKSSAPALGTLSKSDIEKMLGTGSSSTSKEYFTLY
jgi:hypothetical protein